ncbi:MAG: polysaccharide export protein [Acidobacteria bacterium]|nr:polysaccharide export protein [Acidobacteriota bacterium]
MEKAIGKKQRAKRRRQGLAQRFNGRVLTAVFLLLAFSVAVAAQSSSTVQAKKDDAREAVKEDKAKALASDKTAVPPTADSSAEEAAIQAQINSVYQQFYNSYRLGAGDVVAIHIDKHPEDSVEKTTVSPVGQVYFPLLGNVSVAGKTLAQLQENFTTAISEYIREPRVTLSLLESNSSKYGILGDVREPGVKIMTRPLRVFEAITAAGGITDTGSASNVTVLRQDPFGNVQTVKVNVKKMMQGKASPEDNFYLQTGDTIIVPGNTFKTIGKVTSLLGVTGFVSFFMRGGR